MKKNTIKITEEGAMVSKAFKKKANIYGTAEYRMWREFKSENPDMEMITASKKKDANKNKGWTYEKMKSFIETHFKENKDHIDAFNKKRYGVYFNTTAYAETKKWFIETFETTDEYKAACGITATSTTQENDNKIGA